MPAGAIEDRGPVETRQATVRVSMNAIYTRPKRRKTATKWERVRFTTMANTAFNQQMSIGNSEYGNLGRGNVALVPVRRPDRVDGIARALRASFRNSAPLPRDLVELLERLGRQHTVNRGVNLLTSSSWLKV